MNNNSFYEKKKILIKKDKWRVKKMSVSGKYIAKKFSLKKFLVSEIFFPFKHILLSFFVKIVKGLSSIIDNWHGSK